LILGEIDPSHTGLTNEQTAIVTALAALTGGGIAILAGQDAQAAAIAAENESYNNSTRHWLANVAICFLCASPPDNIKGQINPGGGPITPQEVELIKDGDDKPAPIDPFKQKPN
jgi:hypothetical protein